MKKITTTLLTLLCFASTYAQLNIELASEVSYDQDLNDAWGYVAPDGTEYALIGLRNGVSIINIGDPTNPVESDYIEGASSTWRDIKTYGEFAYVTNETSNGVMVIDLSTLPGEVTAYDWTPNIPDLGTLSSCHNIFIDEATGYAYLAGCNLNSGGLLFIDVFTASGTPVFVGAGAPEYSHDVYVRDNKAYSSEINIGVFSVYDVTDKNNPILLASQATESNFTHNTWLSDDGTVLFTTDEVGNAPVGAYDISDLNDIKELDQYRPLETLGDGVIPHNVHVWENWLIVSYYTDGCIILDASRPDNLIEVGNFDTFIPNSTGFDGVWGVYPFLPSGTIIASDIGNGAFMLTPTYVRACYLEGTITNADNNNLLEGATVTLVDELAFEDSGLDGVYKTGIATAGTYDVAVTKAGYETFMTSVNLENGEVTILDVALTPLPNFTVTGQVIDATTDEPVENALIEIENADFSFNANTDASGNFTIPTFFAGDYEAFAGKWGYKTALVSQNINENNANFTIALETGIEDVFSLDLGWTTGGNTFQGAFERATPIEIAIDGPTGTPVILQPSMDYSKDIGNHCFVTGNISDLQTGVLIGGSTSITSPVFDASQMNTPILSFYTWFLNVNVQAQIPVPGNDAIVVTVDNGTTSVVVAEIIDESFFDEQVWVMGEVNLADTIELTATMTVTFEVPDDDFNDVSEALVDYFQVVDANPPSSTSHIVEDAFQIMAYPNPSRAEFILDYTIENDKTDAQLVVYNVFGQMVETRQIQQATGQLELGRNWAKGVYFVQIQQGNQLSSSLKVMKQ